VPARRHSVGSEVGWAAGGPGCNGKKAARRRIIAISVGHPQFQQPRVGGTVRLHCRTKAAARDLRPAAAERNKPADISAFDPADIDVSPLLQLRDYF